MAVVIVEAPNGTVMEYTTNLIGQVLLINAEEGEYRVSVRNKHNGQAFDTRTVMVAPNQTVACEFKVNGDAIEVMAPEKQPLDIKTIAIAGSVGLGIVVIGMWILFKRRRG